MHVKKYSSSKGYCFAQSRKGFKSAEFAENIHNIPLRERPALSGGDSGNNSTHTNTTSGTASSATSVSTLDSSTASQIATTDNSSVTFNGTPTATQILKPGDIFIVQDTARKVESISVVNGQTVIKTIEPELHEVINTIDVSGDVLLGEEHILNASVPSKVQLSVKKSKSRRAIDIGGSSTGIPSLIHSPTML